MTVHEGVSYLFKFLSAVVGGEEIDLNSEVQFNVFEPVVANQEINEDTEVVFSSPQHQKLVGNANTLLKQIV